MTTEASITDRYALLLEELPLADAEPGWNNPRAIKSTIAHRYWITHHDDNPTATRERVDDALDALGHYGLRPDDVAVARLTLNRELAGRVVALVNARPERHDQRRYVEARMPIIPDAVLRVVEPSLVHDYEDGVASDGDDGLTAQVTTCGTMACLAGWTVALACADGLDPARFPSGTPVTWRDVMRVGLTWSRLANRYLELDQHDRIETFVNAEVFMLTDANRAAVELFAYVFGVDPSTGALLDLDAATGEVVAA